LKHTATTNYYYAPGDKTLLSSLGVSTLQTGSQSLQHMQSPVMKDLRLGLATPKYSAPIAPKMHLSSNIITSIFTQRAGGPDPFENLQSTLQPHRLS
jgi:hypothetical protein